MGCQVECTRQLPATICTSWRHKQLFGTIDGAVRGTIDGTIDGTVDGTIDGASDGTIDGATDGAIDGATDNMQGNHGQLMGLLMSS